MYIKLFLFVVIVTGRFMGNRDKDTQLVTVSYERTTEDTITKKITTEICGKFIQLPDVIVMKKVKDKIDENGKVTYKDVKTTENVFDVYIQGKKVDTVNSLSKAYKRVEDSCQVPM